MMSKYFKTLLILFLFVPFLSFSQYPPKEFNVANLTVGQGGTVNVPITAGTNWQNITQFSGTFTFDPTVITWNSMDNWGLSNPSGATFTSPTPGVVTFTWFSLISIGPTLGLGSTIFDLKFNVIGATGSTSAITFGGSPQAMAWQNGFGWSGSNFTTSPGSVTIACLSPVSQWTSAPNYYQINFTNTSTNPGTTSWDFGDGNTSTTTSPSHTYTTPGSYTVCMTETNACGSDSSCSVVNVCTAIPISNFTALPNQLNVIYLNGTTSAPTFWNWDFGDGNTSTMTSPSHTYAASGTYTVCLISGNGCGSDTSCQSVTVNCDIAVSNFTTSTTNLTTTFTDGSTGMITSYLWDFGDGNTSTMQNPVHTYAAQGTYNVCLISGNGCDADTTCQTVNVVCPIPVANWSNANAGLSTIFTDMSTGNPISWMWDFDDGTTSTAASPVHTFPGQGTYNVCLTVTNPCGDSTFCQSVTVSCPTSVANFSHGVTNFTADFTDLSNNNPTAWAWDFGDGNTSTLQNPSHTYTANGSYNVCLISTNSCGTDTVCLNVDINCALVVADWSNSMANEIVTFTDNSTNSPTTWAWDFDDGNTSTMQNPVHTYTTAGLYNVCLIATNDCGSDTSCFEINVGVTGLAAISNNELTVSPNPAKEYIHVNSSFEGTMIVEVFGIDGKLVQTIETENNESISTSQWTKGSYIFVIDLNGFKASRKVIIE